MVESTIDKIKDITVERQIRKLAAVIDEQNKKIDESVDFSTDIENLKASDANQTTQINNLKQSVATDKLATESAITALQSKDAEQDGTLTNHATLIQGITESLVSDVQIIPGTTTGDIKVRLERESAAAIDSNNYNLGLPVSAEIIQGTGPSMFKIQITMSTGVKVVSNDFVFTTEAIGNDVYISSFTFKAGNQSGYLSADIGLNNGVTIEANNFLVPTDPNVTSAITDLQTRMTAVEGGSVGGLDELKATVDGHTASINQLDTDVADLQIDKADANNGNQSIVAGSISANNISKGGVAVATVNDIPVVPDISGKVDKAQGLENAGKVLGINASGNVEPTVVSSGEVWEEVDLNNWPTDWVAGDRVKIIISASVSVTANSWTTAPVINSISISSIAKNAAVIELEIPNENTNNVNIPIWSTSHTNALSIITIGTVWDYTYWNNTKSTKNILTLYARVFNAKTWVGSSLNLTLTNASNDITKMWRLKK